MKYIYITPLVTIVRLTTCQLMLTTSGMPTINTNEDADDSQVFSRSIDDICIYDEDFDF